jgi:hypothetical protein
MNRKNTLATLLAQGRLDEIASAAGADPGILMALIRFLYDADSLTRWRASDAMGRVAARILPGDPTRVERVLQRLVWALSDESGMTAWGAAQAIGEIARCDEGLAREYLPLLVSYLAEEQVAVGTDVLVHGVLHALGRVAERFPHLGRRAAPALRSRLADRDPTTRALAAWALGRTRSVVSAAELEPLLGDGAEAERYVDGRLVRATVAEVAAEALGGVR